MGINQETEVKMLVDDLQSIEERLQKIGAKLIHPRVYERNVRFDTDQQSLSNKGAVLRLREDNQIRLTYKDAANIERGITSRQELEVSVSDFDTMAAILNKFGFASTMMYEKYRTTYSVNGVEVVLDELPYGYFIEIEGDNDAIEKTISELGLNDIERREASYVKLFDYVKHHLELDFQDLSFANFAGVEVPDSAFIAPGSIVIR